MPSDLTSKGTEKDQLRLKAFAYLAACLCISYDDKLATYNSALHKAKGKLRHVARHWSHEAGVQSALELFPETVEAYARLNKTDPTALRRSLELMRETVTHSRWKVQNNTLGALIKRANELEVTYCNDLAYLSDIKKIGTDILTITSPEILFFCFLPDALYHINKGAHPPMPNEKISPQDQTQSPTLATLFRMANALGEKKVGSEYAGKKVTAKPSAAIPRTNDDEKVPMTTVMNASLKTFYVLTIKEDQNAVTERLSYLVPVRPFPIHCQFSLITVPHCRLSLNVWDGIRMKIPIQLTRTR